MARKEEGFVMVVVRRSKGARKVLGEKVKWD